MTMGGKFWVWSDPSSIAYYFSYAGQTQAKSLSGLRWPDPDLIRQITRSDSSNHEWTSLKGVRFGMTIVVLVELPYLRII